MKRIPVALAIALAVAPMAWAEEQEQAQAPAADRRGDLQVKDLPAPIPELLERLQSLSRKIEPEISKLGSKLGHELDETVKRLRQELQSQRHRESD